MSQTGYGEIYQAAEEKRPPDEPGSEKMIMRLFLITSCIKIIKGAAQSLA